MITQERLDTIVKVLKGGSSRSAAASIAGLSPSTMNIWLRKGELLASREDEIPDEDLCYLELYMAVIRAEADIEKLLVDRWAEATESDWQAAMQMLARRFPEHWATKQRVEPEKPKENPIRVEIYLPDNGRDE